MSMLEDVADKLAKETMDLINRTGDEMLENRVAEAIGASSPTLEETFLTAMRIRKAENRGRAVLATVAAELDDTIVLPAPEASSG